MANKKQHGGKRIGAGRKPANSEGLTITIAASVPESLVKDLDGLADDNGWSRSRAITEAIRAILARKKKRC